MTLTRGQLAAGADRPPPPPPPPRRTRRTGGTLVSPRGQGTDNSSSHNNNTEDSFVLVEETQVQPTRLQPPSAPTIATEQGTMYGHEEEEEEREATETGCWILRCRTALPPSTSPHGVVRPARNSPLISIHVSPNMTVDTLAACLYQAASHHYAISGTSILDNRQDRVVGLYEEGTGIFYSLSDILTQRRGTSVVFWIHLPPPRPPVVMVPWWHQWWPALVVPVLLWLLNEYFFMLIDTVVFVFQWLYHVFIQLPLQELYRYGPWFLGWEGAALASICTRITYHGDKEFWRRNMGECERIYATKEEAFLRLARPMVGVGMAAVAVVIIRWILMDIFRRPVRGHPVDREMVELYRAWQVMLRSVQRTWTPPHARHSQPMTRTSSVEPGRRGQPATKS